MVVSFIRLKECLGVEAWTVAQEQGEGLLEPLLDVTAVVELGADPVAMMLLAGVEGRAPATERIEHEVAGFRRDEDRALGDEELQLVHASRISFINDTGNAQNSNTYGYDLLDRLTSAVLPSRPFAYGYDAVGNRSSKTVSSSTDTYAYGTTSNRLASITAQAGAVRSFSFDPNGSTVNDGINQYAYDARGRMVQSIGALGTTNYQVNALGQRIRKTNSTEDRVYLYDTRGRLIAETGPGGTLRREYVYVNDIPMRCS